MPNKNNWLSFVLKKEIRNTINEINNKIKNKIKNLEIIDYNLIHITCVFFGKSLQGKTINILKSANKIIMEYIKKLKEMNITLIFDRFDYLPFNKKEKKLLIAIYKNNNKLKSWNLNLRKELYKLGICNYITDDFMPHVTIGKVKNIHKSLKFEKYPNININDLYLDGIKNKYILNNYIFKNK